MAITKYIFERKTVIGPYIDSYFNLSYSIVKVLRRNNLSSRQYSPLIKKYCLEKHNYLMTKARCNPPCSDSNSRYKERIEENRGLFMKIVIRECGMGPTHSIITLMKKERRNEGRKAGVKIWLSTNLKKVSVRLMKIFLSQSCSLDNSCICPYA